MKFPWFRLYGIFFIPVAIPGWVILLSGAGYSVFSFIKIDSSSHSVSDTLMNFVFRLAIILAGYSIVAFLTSRYKSKNR